jgi:hypothetical protein
VLDDGLDVHQRVEGAEYPLSLCVRVSPYRSHGRDCSFLDKFLMKVTPNYLYLLYYYYIFTLRSE